MEKGSRLLNVALEPSTCDYYDIVDLDRGFIPPEWRALVGDRGGPPGLGGNA